MPHLRDYSILNKRTKNMLFTEGLCVLPLACLDLWKKKNYHHLGKVFHPKKTNKQTKTTSNKTYGKTGVLLSSLVFVRLVGLITGLVFADPSA